MDEETLSRLFTPFTQADASTTRRYGGTGLGLSISHRLVELMGGALTVKSALRRGSKFVLRLPISAAPVTAEAVPAALDLTGLVVVVEGASGEPADDWAAYLVHGGASVHRVGGPEEAREWLLRCAPGLCIVVTSGTAQTLNSVLADLRAVRGCRQGLDTRFVAIERGPGHGTGVADDRVNLSDGPLHRQVLIKAVARAAGRVEEELAEHTGADSAPGALSTVEAGAQGRLILVAEDNEINQKVLRQQLSLLGFTAHIAGDGREALELLQRGSYPLLLTDLHMPRMDGYELTTAIRNAEGGDRRMAIVALTANAVKGEADHCRVLGMDDYMTKPVQLAALSAMLRRWMPSMESRVSQPKPAVSTSVVLPVAVEALGLLPSAVPSDFGSVCSADTTD